MEKKKKNNFAVALGCVLLIVLVLLVFYLLTDKKETHIIGEKNESDLSTLVCTTESKEHAFFISESANKQTHEVKVLFRDGVIDKLNYTFRGEYDSSDLAQRDKAAFLADYNNHVGGYDKDPNLLIPSFKKDNEKLIISLYLDDMKDLNFVFSRFFFIKGEDLRRVLKFSIDETDKYYSEMGFSCIISE